jgi:CRP/FNR family transcriptional regulator
MEAAVNASSAPDGPGVDVPSRPEGRVALASVNQPARMSQVCGLLGIAHDAADTEDYGSDYALVKAGGVIFGTGEPLRHVHLIVSGTVKVHFQLDSTHVIADFLLPGALLGLDALDTMSYTGSATAVSDVLLVCMPYTSFIAYGRKHPEFDEAVMRVLSRQIARAATFVNVLARANAEERMAFFLLDLAARAGRDGKPARQIDNISRKDIAAHLGIAYETAVRILNRFRDDKLLAWELKTIVLFDVAALRDLCPASVKI